MKKYLLVRLKPSIYILHKQRVIDNIIKEKTSLKVVAYSATFEVFV